MIYFIRSPDGPIKIGTSIHVSQRLKELTKKYGRELEVLAVTEGDYDVEQELHRRFRHLKVVNEWFEPGDDLMGFIVAEAKPWDGTDEVPMPGRPKSSERDDVTVRLDRTIAAKARYIAEVRGVSLAEYLSGITSTQVDRDFVKASGPSKGVEGTEGSKP